MVKRIAIWILAVIFFSTATPVFAEYEMKGNPDPNKKAYEHASKNARFNRAEDLKNKEAMKAERAAKKEAEKAKREAEKAKREALKAQKKAEKELKKKQKAMEKEARKAGKGKGFGR